MLTVRVRSVGMERVGQLGHEGDPVRTGLPPRSPSRRRTRTARSRGRCRSASNSSAKVTMASTCAAAGQGVVDDGGHPAGGHLVVDRRHEPSRRGGDAVDELVGPFGRCVLVDHDLVDAAGRIPERRRLADVVEADLGLPSARRRASSRAPTRRRGSLQVRKRHRLRLVVASSGEPQRGNGEDGERQHQQVAARHREVERRPAPWAGSTGCAMISARSSGADVRRATRRS